MATFEVSVTPKWKKKVPVDPSPILTLERFKGTPSLLFKDLKVGQTCTKGLWIRNSNDCTVTVCMTKLPPAERGLAFSEIEFNLDALESKRVEVTWLPICPGTWRDVVHVQVWGLPPPHLNYRVVLHLSSVEPKAKHKCCHVNPPLRAQNAHPKLTAGAKKAATIPGACATCCKRNVVKNPSKAGAASTTAVARAGGKENASRIPSKSARLIIKSRVPKAAPAQQHSTPKRSSTMDEDSLEEDRVVPAETMPLEPFLPMEEGSLLPPCSIPSTPIRRVTYNIRGDRQGREPLSMQSPETPVNAATFTVLEEEMPRALEHNHMFIQKMKEIQFSPVTKVFDQPASNSSQCDPGDTSYKSHIQYSCVSSSQYSSSLAVEQSVLIAGADVKGLPLLDFDHDNSAIGGRGLMPSQSSPIHRSVANSSTRPPHCSPILLHKPLTESGDGWAPSSACGFTEYGTKTDVAAINHTYTKVQTMCMQEYHNGAEVLETAQKSSVDHFMVQLALNDALTRRVTAEKDVEGLATVNSAACVIQKNWRRIIAKRKAEKLRLEKLLVLHRAAIIIQKNWRYALAKKKVAKLRAQRLEAMENAACVLQKNWRRLVAMKLAAKMKSERQEAMNKAAIVIQRSWRYAIAKRRARKLRADRISEMNTAACMLQRNWRCILAMRLASKLRAERLEGMNKAAIVIQRNWRYALAKKQARLLRAERIAAMYKAVVVIQRNLRYVLAKRQARILRAERIVALNNAACIFQKNWRCILAMRLASKLRADRNEAMNKSAIVIQRSWRYVLAKKRARILRAERIMTLNKAACVFQKNWRCILAMRLASKLRAERKEARNKSAIVIQRSWRHVLAKRRARLLRAERIAAMNKAAVVIQKNWKCTLAMREAAKLRAERLKAMNKAACVFQKYCRRLLAMRLADKLRAERLEAMNRAACAIQKNWRVVLAKRITTKLREKRLEEMNVAACVIQKNWRRVLSQRLAATLRAEKANDYSALRQEFAMKVCSKFHLEMSAFDLMHKLVSSSCPNQDVSLALKYIQNGLRTKMLPPFALPQCNKATQTGEEKAKEFTKPKATGSMLRRRTIYEKQETPKTSASIRRCLCQGMSATGGSQRGSHMSPIRRKLGQKEVPEKVRWSSVAEAVGCTPRK